MVPKPVQPPLTDAENEPCPVCKTDRYLNPNLQLMVSPCFHKMCTNCVNRIFGHGAAPCPFCKTTLRKTNFVKPLFEDMYVEKECRIRKRVKRIFNKRPEDFDGDLRAFNDYLEKVEEVIFDLVGENDVDAVENKIEEYAKENAHIIQKNLQLEQEEESAIKQILQDQQRDFRERQEEDMKRERDETRRKANQKQQVIEQFAAVNKKASDIIHTILDEHQSMDDALEHVEKDKRRVLTIEERLALVREGMKRVHEASELPNPFEDPLESEYVRNDTPALKPQYYDPSLVNYTKDNYVRAKAGGFTFETVYKKAIQSLNQLLFVEPLSE